MQIGRLARLAGVSVKALRYYEEIGVLDRPTRTPSGYRDYAADALERVRFVRASQASGLTLGEIREIVAFRDRGASPCAHVTQLLGQRANQIDRQIDDLRRARTVITELVERARTLDPAACSPSGVCHVIPR